MKHIYIVAIAGQSFYVLNIFQQYTEKNPCRLIKKAIRLSPQK